jgi:Peptidase family M28
LDARPVEERVVADSAWAALITQLRFGPRVPGTEAHRRCGDWLVGELRRRGARVEEDTFTYRDSLGAVWPLRNILGHLGPSGNGRLLLVAHWDTRPWADQDPDPAGRNTPIPGASDGASGVAVLLEVARVLQGETLPRGIDILFADGEDLGRSNHSEGFCRGTRRFAERPLGGYWRGVVLDLVGDADLHLQVEQYSLARAPEVVDWIWERGTALAPDVFSTTLDGAIFDDHLPLLDAGLPTADVIDIDYAAWHTHADDVGAVSAASLAVVARVTASLARSP